MLVLRRGEGQWIEVVHHSGDILRIGAQEIRREPRPGGEARGRVDLVFDDGAKNFAVNRSERRVKRAKTRTKPAGS